MEEDNLPEDELIEETEDVETEESEVAEEDDSEIPEQWRKLDKKGMAKVFRDKDSFIGKLQDESRRKDAEAARLSGRLETLEDQLTKISSKPDKEDVVEFDYDKPMESIDKLVDRKIEQREKRNVEYSQKVLFDKCSRAHQDGFKAAVAANPKLFDGIESEVNDAVFAGFNQLVMQGQDVSDDLRNPGTFKKVARYMRVDRDELDYLKGNTIEPVPSDLTEQPQSGGSAGIRKSPKSLLTPQVRKMMKGLHISEKEALAMAKETQDEEKEGL